MRISGGDWIHQIGVRWMNQRRRARNVPSLGPRGEREQLGFLEQLGFQEAEFLEKKVVVAGGQKRKVLTQMLLFPPQKG